METIPQLSAGLLPDSSVSFNASRLKVNPCFGHAVHVLKYHSLLPLTAQFNTWSFCRQDRLCCIHEESQRLSLVSWLLRAKEDGSRRHARTASGRVQHVHTSLHTLTNVEEQDGPDWESQSAQVALCVGTPLEANHQ